jgi:AcrR family transcriptional regulator
MASIEESTEKAYSKGALNLILTAERLFGERGIDNVSLRQIVTAAGQANSYAVQHSFGDKKGLIQAVYDLRAPVIDAGRKRRLEAAKDQSGNVAVSQLLAAMYMPILEDLSETSQRSYALFNSRMMQVDLREHPFRLSKVPEPGAEEIVARLRKHFVYLPEEVFHLRLRLATEFFLAGMEENRLAKQIKRNPYPDAQSFWNELLQALEALLRVPYTFVRGVTEMGS